MSNPLVPTLDIHFKGRVLAHFDFPETRVAIGDAIPSAIAGEKGHKRQRLTPQVAWVVAFILAWEAAHHRDCTGDAIRDTPLYRERTPAAVMMMLRRTKPWIIVEGQQTKTSSRARVNVGRARFFADDEEITGRDALARLTSAAPPVAQGPQVAPWSPETLEELLPRLEQRQRSSGLGALSSDARWLDPDQAGRDWLRTRLRAAGDRVRWISYSAVSWRTMLEREVLQAAKNGAKVQVLLLDPASEGFRRKTLLEAWSPDIHSEAERWSDRWLQDWTTTRSQHASDIDGSRQNLQTLSRRASGERGSIDTRLYPDTPQLYGMLIDDTALAVSSYFLEATERGMRLPFLCIDDVRESPWSPLAAIFRNWFDIHFALGRTPESP